MADDRNAPHDQSTGGKTDAPRDTDGRGSANRSVSTPRGPDEEAVNDAMDADGGRRDDAARGPDAVDLEDMSGATRREPGR